MNATKRDGSILYRIAGSEVEEMNTERIVSLLHPDRRGVSGLSSLLGAVTVLMPDTEARHGEVFLCDRARAFCHRLYSIFPYWGFFFSVKSMSLWKMSLSLLANTRVLQFQRPCDTKFVFNLAEFQTMIEQHVADARCLGNKGLVSEVLLDEREAALRDYFSRLLEAHRAACPPY